MLMEYLSWLGEQGLTLQPPLGDSCHILPVWQATFFKEYQAMSPPRRQMSLFSSWLHWAFTLASKNYLISHLGFPFCNAVRGNPYFSFISPTAHREFSPSCAFSINWPDRLIKLICLDFPPKFPPHADSVCCDPELLSPMAYLSPTTPVHPLTD